MTKPGSDQPDRVPGQDVGRVPRTARLPLPGTVSCDQCSGSMHRQGRMFVCDRCDRALTVATVARLQPGPNLTEG
jgi:hypothetical protein